MRLIAGLLAGLLFVPCLAAAQPAATDPGPPVWQVTASAGLSLTSGNSDTSTLNAAFSVLRDAKASNAFKVEGLLIRGRTEGVLATERASLDIRDEHRIDGGFAFVQGQYLHDRFKDVDYLVASTVGLGYKLLDSDATMLSIDGSLGGVWERNPGRGTRSSGALTMNQKFTQSLSSTAALSQSIGALWKTRDLSDSLFTLRAGVAASISSRTQLKVEVLDTYKNAPTLSTIKKNDIAILLAVVYKT